MYQVKFTDPKGKTILGIHQQYSKQAEEYAKRGLAIVEDAILPKSYAVPLNELTEIETNIGRYDFNSNRFTGGDEFHQYVENEFDKAQKLSDSLDGLKVGSLFGIGVGDGTAWYVVTKVNKVTCKVEWRGFCLDRWADHHFGYGGTFPKKDVERYITSQRALDDIFKRG